METPLDGYYVKWSKMTDKQKADAMEWADLYVDERAREKELATLNFATHADAIRYYNAVIASTGAQVRCSGWENRN
jgi:hypothetical protein